MFRRVALSVLALIMAAVCSAQQNYAQRTTTIRAGIVLIDSDSNGTFLNDWAPHALYNLNLEGHVKPNGWTIDNPDHPGQWGTTSYAYQRWSSAPSPYFNAADTPVAGNQLTKQDAAYWEVPLDTISDRQVGDFDVLILAAHGAISLNPTERERLRRFMDGGGILWVDLNSGTTLDEINGLPIPFMFGTGSPNLSANYQAQIMQYPNALAYTDLVNMAGPGANGAGVVPVPLSGIPQFSASLAGDSEKLLYAAGNATGMLLSYANVGDGYEVVSTEDVLTTINQGGTGTTNLFEIAAPPVLTAQTDSAARFAFNVMSLNSEFAQAGGGSRKTGSIGNDIGAPVLQEFTDEGAGFAGSGSYAPSNLNISAPVAYKGMVIISSGTQILVYDGNPPESLTPYGDANFGNPDDGYPDYSLGYGYDLIWESATLTGPISPPLCCPGPVASVTPNDQIWVVDGSGNLQGFNLYGHFVAPFTNVPPDYTIDAPNGPSAVASGGTGPEPGLPANGPFAPTYQDGLLFVADCTASSNGSVMGGYAGVIWIADTYTGTALTSQEAGSSQWSVGGNQANLYPPTASPTVGYVPIGDNSGGEDRIVYIPTRAGHASGNGAAFTSAGIASIWMGAKGENDTYAVNGSTLQVTTRVSGHANGVDIYLPTGTDTNDPELLSLAPRITIVDSSTGLAVPETTMNQIFSNAYPTQTSNGVLTYTLSNPSDLPANFSVREDYTLDWGMPALTNSAATPYIRGTANFSDDSNLSSPRRVIGNVILGPTGLIYAVLSTQDSQGDSSNENGGGDYYALQEFSYGSFNVLSRWTLHDEYIQPLQPGTPAGSATSGPTATVLPAVSNQDPLLQLVPSLASTSPFYAGQMQYLTFTSGPVLAGGVLYVTAQGMTNTGSPDTILFAFNANPPSPTIVLPTNIGSTGGIYQSEITGTDTKNELPLSAFPVQISNTDTNVIPLGSLSTSTSNSLTPCLSQSQPIVYAQSNVSPVLVYPDQTGSSWSPLEWFTVFSGSGDGAGLAIGPPFVSGQTLFVPTLNDWLPNATINPAVPPTPLMYAINTSIASNDPYLVADQNPWLKQLVALGSPSGQALNINSVSANPDFEWPLFASVTNFSQLETQLVEAELSGSNTINGVIGGNGHLFAWSNTGLYGFERGLFTVCDSGRVAQFDGGGNPLWSTDQSLTTGPSDLAPSGKVHGLVNPTRAFTLSNGNIVVSDAGGNRIAILDKTGRETRSIDGFQVDPGNLPDGYTAGEPLTFSGPRDVLGYSALVSNAVTPGSNPFTSPAPTGTEYWIHYLVADAGNKRLLDIVDRYQFDTTNDVIGAPIALGVLYRHSPSSVSGGQYSYTCVSRVYDPSVVGGNFTGWVDVLGIGNPSPATLTAASSGGATPVGKGGIVLWYEGATPAPVAAPSVITSVTFAGSPAANTLFVPTPGNELSGGNGTTTGFVGSATLGAHGIGDLNSVTARYYAPNSGAGQLYIMFTETSGIYEIAPSGLPLATAIWSVDWMLPRYIVDSNGNQDPVYSVMRLDGNNNPTNANPLDFRPTYATRLANGDVLVTNGYVGRYRKNSAVPSVQFQGEVLEISGSAFGWSNTNLGFNSLSIDYALPPINGTRGLVAPLFASRN